MIGIVVGKSMSYFLFYSLFIQGQTQSFDYVKSRRESIVNGFVREGRPRSNLMCNRNVLLGEEIGI